MRIKTLGQLISPKKLNKNSSAIKVVRTKKLNRCKSLNVRNLKCEQTYSKIRCLRLPTFSFTDV